MPAKIAAAPDASSPNSRPGDGHALLEVGATLQKSGTITGTSFAGVRVGGSEATLTTATNTGANGVYVDAGGTLTTLVAGIDTFGSIVIDDSAAFVGILDLALVDGFDFSEGETYQLFSFASSTGDFTSGLSVDGQALTSAGEVSQPASAPAGLKTPSVTQAWRWT